MEYWNEFFPFFSEMAKEMARHDPEQGDSWKSWDFVYYGKEESKYAVPMEEHLDNLLEKAVEEYQLEPDITHLIDIANFCAMRYLRGSEQTASDEDV